MIVEQITKEEIRELEAALRKHGLGDTLDVIQKRETERRTARRADNIEKAFAPLRGAHDQLAHYTAQVQSDMLRADYEASTVYKVDEMAKQRVAKSDGLVTEEEARALIWLERPDLYAAYEREQEIDILTAAAVRKHEQERINKEELKKQERAQKQSAKSAKARIKALAVERQKRDGGTLEEAERVIRLENPDLVNEETWEEMK